MSVQRKSPHENSIEELDRELIARGAPNKKKFKFRDREGTPQRDAIMARALELYNTSLQLSPNVALSHISTSDLVKILMFKTGKLKMHGSRGIWGYDDRRDLYDIVDERFRMNAGCVAAIINKDSLIDEKGFSIFKVKNYGKTFNLCHYELFYDQPVTAGRLSTGFLVEENIIATAGHLANESNVKDLRIVFGYKMHDPSTPAIRFSNESIYKGVKIIERVYHSMGRGTDWALVKLDRKVEGQVVSKLSRQDIIRNQPVYVIGHPMGLPLKIAPGAFVCDVRETSFVADLDVFMGNPGSPVFDRNTHEVIGVVVRSDDRDFRWTGHCWASIIYPRKDIYSRGPQCTKVSEFIAIVDKL